MNHTDLPPLIRECVDGGGNPISLCEIKARAALTEHAVRRAPVRRGTRLGVAGAGLAAAGVAGALAASQMGGGAARAVLTAAVVKHMASASQAAMTSGEAGIQWTSGSSSVVQDITFDGSNWDDVLNPGQPSHVTYSPKQITRTGESIDRVVDGQAYHYPAIVQTPSGPRFEPRWSHIVAPGAAQQLDIPDPRSLLSVLSPSAGFVSDGSATVNEVQVQHLHATTPGGVPVSPLDPIIQSEPDNARVSALDLWVDSSGVVLKAQVTVSGTDSSSTLTPAGEKALEQYAKQHDLTIPKEFQNAPMALSRVEPGVAALLKQPGMVTTRTSPSSVTVTVTFSKIGQPQQITVPSNPVDYPSKG
jgi:hypothetical protein